MTGQKKLSDDDTQLHEGREKFVLAGNLSEKEAVMHLTRHGLYRRPDAKFAEFVAQPTGDGEDDTVCGERGNRMGRARTNC